MIIIYLVKLTASALTLLLEPQPVLIGVSGGPDSMVLLDLILQNGYIPIVCFVNYHTRPESDLEEDIVRNYCQKNNLSFNKKDAKILKQSGNFQDLARKERMDFFLEMAEKYQTFKLFLAHHLDDHLETYLIQKNRGVTPNYYGLMTIRQYFTITIYRPLLNFSKNEIIDYAINNGVSYNIDSSNYSTIYLRNRIRLELKEMNINERLKLINEIDEVNFKKKSSLSNIIDTAIKSVNIFNFLTATNLEQTVILNNLVKDFYPGYLSSQYIQEIIKTIRSRKPHILIPLSPPYFLEKSYGTLEVNKIINLSYSFLLSDPENIIRYADFILAADIDGIDSILVPFDALPLTISSPRQGDTLIINNHRKSLNRFYIDNKVPHRLRRELPIIKDKDQKIIFIPGYYHHRYHQIRKINVIIDSFILFYDKISDNNLSGGSK